jgi:hypothetical protein
MVSVLGLAVMATVQRSALPEGISLAVWGIGLIAAGAQVREVIPMGHADAAKTGLIRPKTKPVPARKSIRSPIGTLRSVTRRGRVGSFHRFESTSSIAS